MRVSSRSKERHQRRFMCTSQKGRERPLLLSLDFFSECCFGCTTGLIDYGYAHTHCKKVRISLQLMKEGLMRFFVQFEL